MNQKITLKILDYKLAICRLEKHDPIPEWVSGDRFFSITKTEDELSVVCSEERVPAGIKAEKDWRALKVKEPLDFALTGVIASLATPLSEAGISIFAISTYDTDYLLVKSDMLNEAVSILNSYYPIDP